MRNTFMSHLNRYLKISLLALCFSLFSLSASANDQTDVEHAFYHWCASISKDNADSIVKHYSKEAILLPTLSSQILLQKENQIKPYFVKLTGHTGIKCIPQKLITHTHADIAVISGLYTFEYTEKGKITAIPARFTFVYKKNGDTWPIIEHHSSVVPV